MSSQNIYEIDKKEVRCAICECQEGIHICFWSCPLFSDELICVECCQIDTLHADIQERFSEKFGKTLTLEHINKTCSKCGRNYSKQDQNLLPETINNQHPSKVI